MKNFELYLDESGSFQDDPQNKQSNPSLIGGLLIESEASVESIIKKLTSQVHASESYNKDFLKLLQEAKSAGGQFVIFENSERISIINGDITYLNIISEGLVNLFLHLAEKYSNEEISIIILIASRLKVSENSAKSMSQITEVIPEKDYLTRLEEKIILAAGKKHLKNINWETSFGSARTNKRLMIADIICNTYITRNAKRKFTEEEHQLIADLYSGALIFPVFENATVGYLRRLFLEQRYSELLCQICTLPKLSGVTALRNRTIGKLAELPSRERSSILSGVSLQISQYNYGRLFHAGISFAENYKKYILLPLAEFAETIESNQKKEDLLQTVSYWTFDTDFYILTMYDHIGNTPMCAKYLQKCRDNITSINHSWEHLDYYFKFHIRELNCLIGQYDFESVIEKSNKLIGILIEAKELFDVIGIYDDTGTVPTSELLGKVLGVKLEAYINQLRTNPELLEEAINISDAALTEFSYTSDIQRQWQYRSQLMAEAGEPDEAVNCLMKSYNITHSNNEGLYQYVSRACPAPGKVDAFSIMHYTNAVIAYIKEKSGSVGTMMEILLRNTNFTEMLESDSNFGHPWQLILWNIAKYHRAVGHKEKYEYYYKKALKIAEEDPARATLYSFAISMCADHLLYLRERAPKTASPAEADFRNKLSKFEKAELSAAMRALFCVSDPKKIHNSELTELSHNYLR